MQQRASAILLAAKGWQNKGIAAEVKLDRRQVALWRRRFIDGGVQALMQDATGSECTPSVTPEVELHIVNTTLHEKPAAATHWSTRTPAEHLDPSATTVRRIWQRNGTTTLFAALNTLDGAAISPCQDRHRHEEWLKFLLLIDRKTPKPLALHLDRRPLRDP